MKLIFTTVLWLVFYLTGLTQSRFEVVDGVKIRINTLGIENRKAGEPVLVFESGLGTPMGNWDKVIADSLNLGPILTYDRPGIGTSEAIEEIPTLQNVADRLVKLLEQLDLKPPYVLIGHSLGGVYVRGFAVYYPEKLAGLVIVDPGDFTETLSNKRDYYNVLGWDDNQIDQYLEELDQKWQKRRTNAPAPIQRESQVLTQLRRAEFKEISDYPLPNIPVHILTGGKFSMPENLKSDYFDDELLFRSKMKYRVARWMDVIQSVERGMFFYSGDAGHFVQWEDPELVVASIKLVLKDYQEMKEGDRE